jgi:hypothetical protein
MAAATSPALDAHPLAPKNLGRIMSGNEFEIQNQLLFP